MQAACTYKQESQQPGSCCLLLGESRGCGPSHPSFVHGLLKSRPQGLHHRCCLLNLLLQPAWPTFPAPSETTMHYTSMVKDVGCAMVP